MQWPDVVVFVVAARNIHKELYKKSSSPPGKCGVCACCVLLMVFAFFINPIGASAIKLCLTDRYTMLLHARDAGHGRNTF